MNDPARIPLTHGLFALVDAEWIDRLPDYSWQAVIGRQGVPYAGTRIRHGGVRINVMMHRLILGASDEVVTEWINGDTLDNRSANLRLISATELKGKRSVQSNNSSGYKGVHLKGGRYWIAQIKMGGAKQHIGSFDTALKAAQAYDKAALEHFGKFAFLNFPDLLAAEDQDAD